MKTAKLKVFVKLSENDAAAAPKWLAKNLGLTKRALRQALRELEEEGYAERAYGGWRLTEEAKKTLIYYIIKKMEAEV